MSEHMPNTDKTCNECFVRLQARPELDAPLEHAMRLDVVFNENKLGCRLMLRALQQEAPTVKAGEAKVALLKFDDDIELSFAECLLLYSRQPKNEVGDAEVLLPIAGKRFAGKRWQLQELEILANAVGNDHQLEQALLLLIHKASSNDDTTTIAELASFINRPTIDVANILAPSLRSGEVIAMVGRQIDEPSAAINLPLMAAKSFRMLCQQTINNLAAGALSQHELHKKLGQHLAGYVVERVIAQLHEQKLIKKPTAKGSVSLSRAGEKRVEKIPAPLVRQNKAVAAKKEKPSEQPQKPRLPLDQRINDILKQAGFTPPTLMELAILLDVPGAMVRGYLKPMLKDQQVYLLTDQLYLHHTAANDLRQLLIKHFNDNEVMMLSHLKALTLTSRKFSVALIEFADIKGLTIRDEFDNRRSGPKLHSPLGGGRRLYSDHVKRAK